MKEDLKVSLVQSDIVWEDKEENLKRYEAKLNANNDLIILPEMFSTGFSINASNLAERMDGTTIKWLLQKSKDLNSAICASLIIEDSGYRNRMVFVKPSGEIDYYDKRHLFSMADENSVYTAGNKKVFVNYLGWNINLQICYDLRFPVFSRNLFTAGKWEYDLLIYVANWPSPRRNAWKNLLVSRAIENQCFVAAVNRVGKDANDLDYLGDSEIIDPKGKSLLAFDESSESENSAVLSFKEMNNYRKKFPLGNDADSFKIIL